jgi:hypothetical protein
MTSWMYFCPFVDWRGCVNVFRVLSFCAIGWFDMGVRLVLRDAWSCMLKTCERFGDIVKHGDVDSLSCVILVDVHAEIPLTVPIVRALVVLAEDGGKVFGVFAANILDAKIVHTKCERYGLIVVLPEAWCDGTLAVAVLIQTSFLEFLRKYTRLWEAVHSFFNFDVDVSIGGGLVGKTCGWGHPFWGISLHRCAHM